MIFGIGTDIVHLDRIAKLIDNPAFLAKICTEAEITRGQSLSLPAQRIGYYAKRFAAKEAFSKAFGTGIGEHVAFHDLTIANHASGQPYFLLSDTLTATLMQRIAPQKDYQIHLSLSDDAPFAQAFVVIDKF